MTKHVTRGDWFVSSSWPPGRLSVSRYHPKYRNVYGKALPGNSGRIFSDYEAMNQYCLERGYLQPYINQEVAIFKKKERLALRHAQRTLRKWATNATSYRHLFDLSQGFGDFVRSLGLDDLNALRFSNGAMTMFHHLRPELFRR